MRNEKLMTLLQDKDIRTGGPHIVAIGGGTGLSVLLRGLKRYTSNITAIVTVSDDGGSSGMLREDMGILPPGDIRNCIMALANTEPMMERLMQYRFKEGSLRGQSFGNLFIAALNDICGSFDEAIREISNVLAVTGKVLPVTLEDVTLFAELEDGTIIKGESQIPIKQQILNKRIKSVYTKPSNCKALPEALEAIENADAVVLGPGSLYTSIIPNLLVRDISRALSKTSALRIYVGNIMTQQGETIDYSLSEHINAIHQHARVDLVQYAIVNASEIPGEIIEQYKTENAAPVEIDYRNVADMNIRLIKGNFARLSGNYLRHDFSALADQIIHLIKEEKFKLDNKIIMSHYYSNGKVIKC